MLAAECCFRYPRCNSAYKVNAQKQCSVIFVKQVLSGPTILSSLPQMLQLSTELLGTSGPLAALLNSHCLSETPLSNMVNKFPFIEASLSKQKSLSFLKSNPFLSGRAYGEDFSGQIKLDEREHVQKRLRMGSGCLPHTAWPFCSVRQLSELEQ